MNKDALLATIIGFVVGLIITGLLLVGPKVLSFLPKFSMPSFTLGQTNGTTPAPTPEKKDFSFKIDSPLPDAIEDTAEILVSGTAEPGSIVVIQTDTDDEAQSVSDDGKFAGKITLAEGRNVLTVTSYGKSKQESQTLNVYYTQEKL